MIDWLLVADYLEIFKLETKLPELKRGMARLDANERRQLRAMNAGNPQPVVRWPVRPMAEYVAFATFAARFVPPREFKPITQGGQWNL